MDAESLTHRAEVRRILAEMGVRPSKRLGQNFLVDPTAVSAIRDAAAALHPKRIVEIGPGLGAVTSALADLGATVTAVEVDHRLAERLQGEAEKLPHVTILRADALAYDFESTETAGRCVVVGSIPYSITAPLLKHLVDHRKQVSAAILVTQREVAEKIQASPGPGGSALGVMIQAYAEVSIVRRVSRGAFLPVPEVDSSLWTMRFRETPAFRAEDAHFFGVVRAVYGKRRKMLRASLKALTEGEVVADALERAQIDPTLRGEALSLDDLDRLTLALAEAGVFG